MVYYTRYAPILDCSVHAYLFMIYKYCIINNENV